MFDILITVAPKDFNKLRFIGESIQNNIIDYNEDSFRDIFYVSPIAIPDEYLFIGDNLFTDEDIFDFDFSKIKMENRRGWYRQQFIKLFQEVTADNYLVIDSDAYINKPLKINPAYPDFYLGKDQHHLPYFRLLKEVLNLDRVYSHSFISEMMFFKRGIIRYLLGELGISRYDFFDVVVDKINEINDGSSFSEYEMYGNYVTKNWPDLYKYKNIEVSHQWKKREWTDKEIVDYVSKYKNTNYNILTMHSWI